MSFRSSHVAASTLAVAFALAASTNAVAEPCECRNVSFDWHGCDAASCDPGAWTTCTPSADDTFNVRNGCHVTVEAGDDVLLEQAAPDRFFVQAGGSVVVRGPVEWRVGPGGFLATPGSRVEFSGCFRSVVAEEPACSDTVGANERFLIGDVRPCRDFDCADDAEIVRIAYPTAVYGDWGPLLARLDPDRDALCFWQASENGPIGADAGYCYRIVAIADEGDEPWIDFDVRQTWRAQSDQAGYPLARRVVQQGSLLGDHAVGAREIRLRETDVVVGRTDQMGRFVRCGDRQRAHLIASVRDEPGGDVLVLADDRGIDVPFDDGSRCHVDWGWGAGDLAFAMAPVHVTSATNVADQVYVRLEGAASLRGVVFDGLGGSGGSGRGAVQIDGGPLERFEHVWITDPLVRDREAIALDDLPCDARIRHLTITGGPREPDFDKNYGLLWFGGATCTYSIEHYYMRHRGDDNFVLESTGADPVGGIALRWVHAGPSSAPGDSGQLFDLGTTNPSAVDAQDVLCTACTTQDGVGSLIMPSLTGGVVSRALWVGAFNGGALANQAGATTIRFVDFGLVGSAVDASNARGYGPLLGVDAENFYVRDYLDPRPQSSQLCMPAPPVATRRLRAGVIQRVSTGREPCALAGDAALEDVYFVDVGRTGAPGALLRVTSNATDVALTRLTAAFTAPPVRLAYGIDVASGAELLLDGPLLTGFRGPAVASAMRLGSPEQASLTAWGAPTCFFDDDVDDDEETIAAYGTPPLRGVDPMFRAPAAGRFDLDPASPARAAGCGAGTAGIRTTNWAHRKAKLEPVFMGPKPRACGLGFEALLALGALSRLRPRART